MISGGPDRLQVGAGLGSVASRQKFKNKQKEQNEPLYFLFFQTRPVSSVTVEAMCITTPHYITFISLLL